jgi:nucleotide-binding universal stress UspA family protein
MSIIRRILVPTDFGDCSDAAVHYAADIAGRLGATVELLHVVDDSFVSGAWAAGAFAASSSGLLDDLSANATSRLTETATALAARGVATDLRVVTGSPSAAIAECAQDGGFDLIIMGTHGRTGLSRVVIGNVAERVLRAAPCAVLTVKARTQSQAHTRLAHAVPA